MEFQLDLPLELAAYRDKFMASVLPFIKILPQAAEDTPPWASKIGGLPYLPLDAEWPRGEDGMSLFFLAQINFEEVPKLEPFPKSGVLQFFIASDGMYGMEKSEQGEQRNFRVIFHETVEQDFSKLQTDFDLPIGGQLPIDPALSFPLKFELQQEAAPLSDHRIHDFIEDDFFSRCGNGQWEMMEAYSQVAHAGGHKLGGYAFFAQRDPRSEGEERMELLFQLDSDQAVNCQWGDMGTGHFFIKKEDLGKRDFSKVSYQWDCY